MSKDHCVSRFHLSEFCDPNSVNTPNPWLWVGTIADGSVKRRSPKNVATSASLFAGPGAFNSPEVKVESFLANEVESPAAFALRALRNGKCDGSLPPELMRYLAWAASRSLPMQRLEIKWADRFNSTGERMVEPPPEGLARAAERHRAVRLLHPEQGQRTLPANEEIAPLLDAGWFPDPTEQANFLEGVHIQAHYFQARWFPRLRWFTLKPPPDSYFILGDRPVGWGTPECLNAPPACLRDPDAFLIAPLSHSLALVGRNSSEPWAVTPQQINSVLAGWSHDWIVGPSSDCVEAALHERVTTD